MKKSLKYSFIIIGFIIFFNLFIYSKVEANTINNINMDVFINSDGNANITETWDVSVNKGTECYKSFSNLENSVISNFSVSDDKLGQYTNISSWNVNASLSDKSGKCGINKTSSNTELCWGISEYGKRNYTLKYTISNFVTQYTDKQGIYFNLLNLDQSIGHAIITIHSDTNFSLENSRIWAFGYKGSINFTEGSIVMDSGGYLSSSQYMVCLVRFEKNLFNTKNNSSKSFDDIYDSAMSTVNKEENHKSKFSEKLSKFGMPVGYVLFGLFIIYVLFFLIKGLLSAFIKCLKISPITTIGIVLINIFLIRKSIFIGIPSILVSIKLMDIIHSIQIKRKKKLLNEKLPSLPNATKIPNYLGDVENYRDVPFQKNIWCAALAADFFNDFTYNDTFLMGAILLKWVKNGNIEITENKNGIFDIKNSNYSISFKTQEGFNYIESKLWNIFISASGTNNILEPNELKSWCSKHYREMMNWYKECRLYQQQEAQNLGFLQNKKSISESFVEEAKKLKGLKKFLLDYSLMSERQHFEVHIWEDYLIFAEVLGIADKVEQEFKQLYPNLKTVSKLYSSDYITATKDISYIAYSFTEFGKNNESNRLSTLAFSKSSSSSSHDYSGIDRDSGGGGDSYDSGGSSAGGSSGGGFR